MKNHMTKQTFREVKNYLLILLIQVLIFANVSAKRKSDETNKKLLPPPTPTVVLTLPTGTDCYSVLTASGCGIGATATRWYSAAGFYSSVNPLTVTNATPIFLRAACFDGTSLGAYSAYYKAVTSTFTEITSASQVTICSASPSALLNASSASSGLIYQWKKNNVNLSGEVNSSYTATTAGSYSLQSTLGSCTSTSSPVVVANLIIPLIGSTVTGSCGSNTIDLSVTNVFGGTFQWKLDGVNISGATTSTYSIPSGSTGIYTVEYTSNGCVSVSLPHTPTLVFNPAVSPSCNISLTATGCSTPLTYFYQYNTSSSTWDIISAYSSTATSVPVPSSITTPTDFRFTCAVSPFCANGASNTVTVIPTNYTTVSQTGACSSVSLTANTTFTGVTYQWQRNNVNISGATNVTYTATVSGAYRVITTKGLCNFTSVASTVTVVVPPTPTITSTAVSPATITNGQSLTLTANGCTGGTVLWSNSATTVSIAVTPASNTTYTFTCTVSPCTAVTSSSFVVNVSPLLPPILTSSAVSTCTGSSVTLTATACAGGGTVTWSTAQTGLVISVSPSVTTNYIATCTVGSVTSVNSLPLPISVFNGAITSLTSGNWNTPAMWSCNCIPADCNDVTVNTGHVVTISASQRGRLKNLTLRGTVDVRNTGTMALK
jgi:hypothetical protein